MRVRVRVRVARRRSTPKRDSDSKSDGARVPRSPSFDALFRSRSAASFFAASSAAAIPLCFCRFAYSSNALSSVCFSFACCPPACSSSTMMARCTTCKRRRRSSSDSPNSVAGCPSVLRRRIASATSSCSTSARSSSRLPAASEEACRADEGGREGGIDRGGGGGGGAFVRVGGRANERVGPATSRRENAARTSAVSPPAGASPFFDVVVAAAAPLFSASASASPSEDVPAGGADRFAVASRFARRSSSSSIRSFASRTAVMCAFLTYFCPPNSSAFALRFLSSSALRRSILAGGTLGRARGRCGEIQMMMRSVWSYTVMCSSHRSFKRHRGQLLKPWSG